MKRHELTVVTVIVFLALAFVAVAAQGSEGPGVPPKAAPLVQGPPVEMSPSAAAPSPGEDRIEALHRKLGITDDQRKAMRQLYASFRDRTRKARMGLASLRDEKRTMLMSGNVDQKKLAQIDEQVVKFVSEVLTERLKMQRDRLALLTPEQLDRFADLVAKRTFRSELGKMRGRHGHGGF